MQILSSLEELEAHAQTLAERLVPKHEGATLVTLSGELGVGKTAFAKALARALGVTEDVISPTFILARTYSLQNQAFHTLTHIDAYRLENESALAPLRLNELLADPTQLIVFEWPEHVRKALPSPDVSVTLALRADGSREISYG